MAHDPDPGLELTTLAGRTRTLDDWTTMFHLALVVLPGRPEGAAWVRVGRRIAEVFGGSDCRPAFLVVGTERSARRVLGDTADKYLCFVDPDGAAVKGLGITRVPAFVVVRLNTTIAGAAEGWDPDAWDDVAASLAAEMAWTKPLIPAPGDPAPHPGWTT